MKIHRSLAAFITILFIICLITPAQAAWENINSLVEITQSVPEYDATVRTASVTITITNTSVDIAGDIRLIVSGDDLPINFDGITDEEGQEPSPYYDILIGQTGIFEAAESSFVTLVFSVLAEGDPIDFTLGVEVNDAAIYKDIFRKNISRAPEEFSGAGMIKVMSVYVDGRSSKGQPYVDCNYYDCDTVTFDTLEDPNDVIQVKPLIVTYEQEIEDAAFNPVPDHTDEVTLARDVIAAVSYDDGATWKRNNISKTARKSSFMLDNGVAYLGDSEKIDFTVEGDCVLITWVDKYARSGNPWDLDANYDYYQIMGPQRSVDYLDVHGDDDPRPDLGQKPFSALYGARGYLDPNLGQIVWFKGDQITTGRHDAVRNYTAGLKDGGFAVSWQEDPKGLKTGKGMGPGAGMSGACVNHKTDLWYSYIEWKDFAVADPNFVPSGGDDGVPLEDGGYTNYVCPVCYYVYDPTENLDPVTGEPIKFTELPADWTCLICGEVTKDLFEKENRPHTLIKMSPPVRVTDNAVCKQRTPEDVWGYACPTNIGGTLCGYTYADNTSHNESWADLSDDWVCPKCEIATKSEFIGPVVVMVKHTGGLWCEEFANNPTRVDRYDNLLLPGDLGYEFGFYTYEAEVMDPNGRMTMTTIPLDGDTGASRPAIALVKSLEDPNQILVVMAYEETKGIGSGSDKVAMASEQEVPVPEQFVTEADGTVVLDDSGNKMPLGGFTNQDCISCHYSYIVPRDRIDPTATTIEACEDVGGTWDESIDAYWPPESTDGCIEISKTIPDVHSTGTNCSGCHGSGEDVLLEPDYYFVGEPQGTKCVEFEVGKQIVPIDAIYSYPNADYYALPDHMPGWHTPVIDCVGCHLPWGTKDKDQDAVPDQFDLCPETPNPDQVYPVDTDGDGIGDSCGEIIDEHAGKFRYGKNLFYQSFPMEDPDVISHGDMLNLKNAYGLLENARRLKMATQKIFDPERLISEQVTLGIYYKQGMNGQGAPADGFLRVFRGGYDITDADYPLNLTSSTVLSFKIDEEEDPDTIEDTDTINGHNIPKVEEYEWTNDNLYDDSGMFIYEQAVDPETGEPLYDENGYPIYAYDDEGNLILPTDENGIPITYCNPYENVFSARIAIRGDRIIIANAHCPNWAAARKAKDTYNFYTRVSKDGGTTWGLPVNVTQMENAEEGVSDCRLVVPLPGIADSPYREETFDPDIFFIAIGTQLNTAQPLPKELELEEGEVFLDVFYTRTRDFGETFETVTWANSNYIEGSLPYLDANHNPTDDPDLAIMDNPTYAEENEGFDWLAKGEAAQGDVQAVCSPDGSRLYAVWEHDLEIGEENVQEHFQGTDVWFRRVTYDNIPAVITVPGDTTLEATSPDGAVAEFEILAIDLEDPDPEIIIEPASGTVFPLGETTVTVTAIDDTGNIETETFTITVVDTTEPELTVPEDIVVILNTPVTDLTIATFLAAASADDIVDQDVAITYNAPLSYGTVGPKVITFTATDNFGNQSGRTAIISVQYDFYGFLSPLNLESEPDTHIIPIKYGKIVPVKFELYDFYGEIVPDVQAYILVYPSQGDVSGDDAIVPDFVGNEDVGNDFRFVVNQYIFNLSTQGPGNPYPEIIIGSGVYTIYAVIDDGTVHSTPLHLKQ